VEPEVSDEGFIGRVPLMPLEVSCGASGIGGQNEFVAPWLAGRTCCAGWAGYAAATFAAAAAGVQLAAAAGADTDPVPVPVAATILCPFINGLEGTAVSMGPSPPSRLAPRTACGM